MGSLKSTGDPLSKWTQLGLQLIATSHVWALPVSSFFIGGLQGLSRSVPQSVCCPALSANRAVCLSQSPHYRIALIFRWS